ncbi:MAG TPA: UDP-glucose 4-epimerase GalE [Blastocatellia bacterium]|nr:UDP-glucose 4-epimerase GalE [Blastocatellia bacterium]
MNVLVTGGAGYIGSVMVEQLIAHGHKTVVYDSLELGHRQAVDPEAVFVQGWTQDKAKLVETFRTHQIEAVIHMAAYALVGESVINPQKYFSNNFIGGLSLLDAMLEADVKKIVFSCTCATYGMPEKMPITEDTPQKPVNPYGESKLAFERALKWYDEAYGLRYASMRYFNAAGASERFGEDHAPETHIIPNVLRVALGQASHVNIFGEDYPTPDGTCVRDYIHVIDLAVAHILALQVIEEKSRIYNLGHSNGYSVAEVVEMARQVTGRHIPTERAERRPGDPPVLIANSDKATLELGWMPQHSELDRIIESAWKWHLSHPNGYDE